MNVPLASLPHRMLSTCIAWIPLVDTGFSYANDGNPWRLLSMLGWAIVGGAWFLRPAVFARSFQESIRRSAALALINTRQWFALVGAGLLVAVLALIAQIVSSA